MAAIGVALYGSACIPRKPPVALYNVSDEDGPLPREQVAYLYGPVGTVDGKDVSSRGRAFSLLPGCHVVGVLKHVGGVDTSGAQSWVGDIPNTVFAFKMLPGATYAVDILTERMMGTGGRIIIRGLEIEPDGHQWPVKPVTDRAQVQDCIAWGRAHLV